MSCSGCRTPSAATAETSALLVRCSEGALTFPTIIGTGTVNEHDARVRCNEARVGGQDEAAMQHDLPAWHGCAQERDVLELDALRAGQRSVQEQERRMAGEQVHLRFLDQAGNSRPWEPKQQSASHEIYRSAD
jgi:hypothetical protein